MKKKELPNFIKGMKQCGSLTAKVGYAVSKNRRKAEQEWKDCENARTHPKGWEEYEDEQRKIVNKHAVGQDSNGNAMFGKNGEKFETEFSALTKKYADLIEKNEKHTKDWEKFLDNEIDFELHKIKETDIPDHATADQRYFILEFVTEEKEPEQEKNINEKGE